MFAPICRSGVMIRCIGRFDSDSSPKIRLLNACAANIPLSIRIVDPEFPASKSLAAAFSPCIPLP